MLNATTIGQLAAGSLAISTRPGNNGFVGYMLRVNPTGQTHSPVIFVGPKPLLGDHPLPGTPHPVFVDMDNSTPCVFITDSPIIEPVLNWQSTGFDQLRANFGNPQGQGKLFQVGQNRYIQVDDLDGDYYYVHTSEWRLDRAAPAGVTGFCSRWHVGYLDDYRAVVVVAEFG